MKKTCSLLLLLAFATFARGDDTIPAVDAYLTKYFHNQPGAAVLIVKQGQPLLVRGYGLSDIEKKTPITTESVFDLASVSKQFTAMAVMQLAERGRLSYHDDVHKWIPELPQFENATPIRIRNLLQQTSGLTDYLNIFKGGDADFARLRNDELPALFHGKKLKFEPGAKFNYSNTNYAFLALIVERASGKTFAGWMRDQIFVPLGMNHTKVMDDPSVDLPNRTTGYGQKIFSKKFDLSRKDGPVCGDGNVFTTIEDMAKWDAALAQCALVRRDTMEQALTPPTFAGDKKGIYGFGWIIMSKDGKRMMWHNGGWSGTSTSISRYIDEGLTVAVLCNNESADADSVGLKIASLYRGEKKAEK